mmetsp:Transcript_133663/g.236600  ORF Transcript_133663/g.236600 Transcript_133663/m.236600 type:complete len:491 (-) Transcript_133663:161-1633(-)
MKKEKRVHHKGFSAKAKCQRRSLGLPGLPASSPDREHWDSAPLEQLKAATQYEVHQLGSLAGASHVVLHRGRCVFTCSEGYANRANGVLFGADTICALHGNTKPLVAAAFLTLVDEGRVKLDDPVSKHWPQFPKSVIVRGREQDLKAQPTFRNLLTMTSGLGYNEEEAYEGLMGRVKKRKVADLSTFCDELAKTPLLFKPGARYEYGFSTDVLGRMCEIISGKRLDKFVEERLLKPLGMKDTHFVVPRAKLNRVSVLYDAGDPFPASKRRKTGLSYEIKQYMNPDSAPGIMSAGGGILSYNDVGMYSTAQDYARFCQMLLNDGVGVNKKRLLQASTVRSIWADGLAPFAREDGRVAGWYNGGGPENVKYWDRVSWSLLGSHVTFDDQPQKGLERQGVAMFMGGGGGTYWAIDKRRKMVVASFSNCFGGRKVCDGSDGHGPRANDAAPYAMAAADGAGHLLPHEYGLFGPPGCDPQKLRKQLIVKLPVADE